MKLVADARDWWRWSSVHAMGAAVAVQGAWAMLPDDLKQHVPAALASGITIGLLVLGVVGRLRDQTPAKIKPTITVPRSSEGDA